MTLRSSYYIRNLTNIYDDLEIASRSIEKHLNLRERVRDRLKFWKYDKDEKGNYKLAVESIFDYKKILNLFMDIFRVMLIELKEIPLNKWGNSINSVYKKEKKIQDKKKNEDILYEFFEKIRDFHSKIPRFQKIRLANNINLSFRLDGNIIYFFENFMNGFYNLVDKKHLENLKKLNDLKEEYERLIKRCYKLYGFTIIISIITLLIILVVIASFQIIEIYSLSVSYQFFDHLFKK